MPDVTSLLLCNSSSEKVRVEDVGQLLKYGNGSYSFTPKDNGNKEPMESNVKTQKSNAKLPSAIPICYKYAYIFISTLLQKEGPQPSPAQFKLKY